LSATRTSCNEIIGLIEYNLNIEKRLDSTTIIAEPRSCLIPATHEVPSRSIVSFSRSKSIHENTSSVNDREEEEEDEVLDESHESLVGLKTLPVYPGHSRGRKKANKRDEYGTDCRVDGGVRCRRVGRIWDPLQLKKVEQNKDEDAQDGVERVDDRLRLCVDRFQSVRTLQDDVRPCHD